MMHKLIFIHASKGIIHEQSANNIPHKDEKISITCQGELGGWNVFTVVDVHHIYINNTIEITVV